MAGEYYQPVYLVVVSILTAYLCFYYRQSSDGTINVQQLISPIPAFILAVVMALFIGLRPQASCFIDSNNYIAYYNLMEGNKFHFESDTLNFIFDNLFRWMASNQVGWPIFFLVIASIYFGGMYVACMKMFPYDTLISFLVCLAAFSTFSFGTNGIKAGAAASLFLIAIAYHRNLLITILFLCLSLGFHHSMTMPIVAFILAYFYRNIKVYFLGWCFCLIIAMLNITFFQTLFAGFTDESGAQYLLSTEDWGGRSGFRFDFVIYSAMPVLVGYWAIFKKQIMSLTYEFLLSIYLTTNSVWMLCMYASFTNRIAYLSWSLYPIVLIYPFLNEDWGENKYRVFTNVVCLHLLFTLFMFFIYN